MSGKTLAVVNPMLNEVGPFYVGSRFSDFSVYLIKKGREPMLKEIGQDFH